MKKIKDISLTSKNNNKFKKTLYFSNLMEVVVMNIPPNSEIGGEIHNNEEQLIRIEDGKCIVLFKENNQSKRKLLKKDDVIIIPKKTWHNIINNSKKELKLSVIYSPSEK